MSAAARYNDNVSTGHGCDTITQILEHSSTVFIDGKGAARKGDMLFPHTINSGQSCIPHTAYVNVGSGTVNIDGIPAARINDSADQNKIIQGSPTVNIG